MSLLDTAKGKHSLEDSIHPQGIHHPVDPLSMIHVGNKILIGTAHLDW
jgi:hypothetical protein